MPNHLATPPATASHGLFRTALCGQPVRLSHAFQQWRAQQQLPLHHGHYGGRVATGDGHDAWDMVSLNDQIFVVMADCHYQAERSEWVLSEAFIELHFTLAGSAIASWPHAPAAPSGDLDLIVCHLGAQARYRITCPPGKRRSLALYVKPSAFARFLDPASRQGRRILAELADVGSRDIYFQRIPIQPAQVGLITQMLHNPYSDCRRYPYIAAKVDELLCSTVESWAGLRDDDVAGLVLGPRDLRRLHQARQVLLADLAVSHTIPSLAAAVGINTAKLKAGFRLLFGCTVHDCIHRARMTHALERVSAGAAIHDIALEVGYQHASSFSAAFTRHFGHSPRQARRTLVNPSTTDALLSADYRCQ